MDQDRLERALEKNANDIQQTALNLAEVVAAMKAGEARYSRDLDDRKETLNEIRKLSDAVANTRGLEKEVANLTGEVGKLRHDVANMMNAQAIMPEMRAIITKTETKVEQIEKTIDQSDIPGMKADVATLKNIRAEVVGGAKVIGIGGKIFWTLFGGTILSGLMALVVWGVTTFADKNKSILRTPANIEITAPSEAYDAETLD